MSKAKISIRFFDNREVRAIWDEQIAKWWFSVLDIVALLTDQNDYSKTRNYWKYLKAKLKKEKNELVSATTQLKLLAADGKRYLTDMLDYNGIISLGKEFPRNGDIEYYQVSWEITNTETEKREFSPLAKVKDNYPKFLLSTESFTQNRDGIIHKNVFDWLLEH